ncbi:hypothetical protein GCM10027446_05560 [Angustibacter peucedani]
MTDVGWKDLAALLAAVVSLGTFVTGLGSLTTRSRLRTKLAHEVDIASKLPTGAARAGLEQVAERHASRLVELEDPVLSRRRRNGALVVIGASLFGLAGAVWTYRTDGWGGLVAVLAGAALPGLSALAERAERRKADLDGRPDAAGLGPHLPR